MLEGALDQLESLALEEKHAVEEAARAAVTRELGPRGAGAPESCLRCGRPSFIGKGRNRDGSRRRPCRGREQTFSAKTMSLPGHSKLKPEVWLDDVSDMLSGTSLRGCAELCGASPKTSWFMRVRLREVMARALQPFHTGESVSWQVDGTYPSESLKGNRSRSTAGMPRKPAGTGAQSTSAAYRRSKPASSAAPTTWATRSAAWRGAADPPTQSSRRRGRV